MDGIAKAPRQSFRMRGRSYVALAFCRVVPIAGWFEEIDVTLARSPGFFAGKPDLSAVDLSQSAIAHLITSLEQRNIRILGIESVDAARLTTSMPPLLTGGRHCQLVQNEPKKPEAKPKPNLLLHSLVRSGQSIFSKGDVTVLGSVGSGGDCRRRAYPCLWGVRGRAMAGSSDNAAARISVKRLKPSCWPSTATTKPRKK
jgi:septum site-determining protein MinC